MFAQDLNLDALGLQVTASVRTGSLLVFAVVSTAPSCSCPTCGTLSDRVHSHYFRTIADLPCHDQPVALRLKVRRFRCVAPDCPRAVFCERLPDVVGAQARTTNRLRLSHSLIGMALGGEAGARLAEALSCPTSPDTLLRRIKQFDGEPLPEPRFVGVDDWAWRKGQSYGTILIDLERGCVIDLFPGRDGAALTEWLKRHPGVEVITRDRWAAFAQAATEGAPQARQVADRWHLLKNLREAVERLLGRHSALVREALTGALPTPATEQINPEPPVEQPTPPGGPRTIRQQARQARQQERSRQFERVKELRAEGLSLRRIARATGLSLKRVIRYARSTRCPDWNPRRRVATSLDPLTGLLDAWVERGGRNAAELYRELAGHGFQGSYDAVRRCLARRLGSTGRPGPRIGPLIPPAAPPPPSSRQLSFEFIRKPEDRKAEQQARLDRLRDGAGLREGLDLAGEFADMVRKRTKAPLAEWLAKAEASGCAELRGFAAGLRTDEAAVSAALTEPWSNGPVEGQVNRLKLIKRQGYGRAGFQLLRARVRFAS